MDKGQVMYDLAKQLFPICRSITGNGFRESLNILKEIVPDIQTHEVPSGTEVFDWTVPQEWNIYDAYIETLDGRRVIDFKECNLHILGYSTPIDKIIGREELLEHIYTQPEQPDWIPYVTSYYKERWGFCMSENQKQAMKDEQYHVVIKSTLAPGSLTYGDLIIPGKTEEEILFSTYLCHPSMANNELSGPVVQTELIKYLKSLKNRRYSYRFVFIPETIGSITYCSRNLDALKKNTRAGFVLSCVGDDLDYSIIESRYADTLADRVLKNVLKYHYPEYKTYSFLKRGSDEREYCAPGIDLPVCGVCRTKYGVYPEYHTSADNMDFISPEGLNGAYQLMVKVINALEYNYHYKVLCKGEPQLGKRGLYPTISQKGSYDSVLAMKDLLAYSDGRNDLIGISEIINQPVDVLIPIINKMMDNNLLEALEQ
jgi:aminopeptidase-like protein